MNGILRLYFRTKYKKLREVAWPSGSTRPWFEFLFVLRPLARSMYLACPESVSSSWFQIS